MRSILDINATEVVRLDEEPDGPSVMVGMLDTFVRASIADGLSAGDASFLTRVRLVRHAVKGWSSVNDAAGQLLEFKTEQIILPGIGKRVCMSESCMNRLSHEAVRKISDKVISMNFAVEDAEKN